MSERKYSNALLNEKSPYLLQHAHNPVNWLPWGEAAFAKARAEDKPIFLSVGYSTCHWCHVMERESFENEEMAAVLNEHFICVKVDREERPDVDLTYMSYVQALTGSGGWPMTVWLTPNLKPFYGGTYFPPEDKYGRAGLKKICTELARIWKEDRAGIMERSDKTMDVLQKHLSDDLQAQDLVVDSVLHKGYDDVTNAFDYHEGGFSGAPKFPRPVTLALLWRLKKPFLTPGTHDSDWCGTMVQTTLTQMAHGGIRDHIGGGFHRYSVDMYWHIPHYEKMLYDQGQLLAAYVEAVQNTGSAFFSEVARGIIQYVKRDMRHPEGGFYSAEDADSYTDATKTKKGEGAFYVWSAAEIDEILGKNDGNIFRYAYGARRDGNARPESDPHGELKGLNTLFRAFSARKTAEFFKLEEAQVQTILDQGKQKLLEARNKRPRPHLDDKILTAWNGLMITGLAKAARVLQDAEALSLAESAAHFVRKHLCEDPAQGRKLKRSWRENVATIPAFAADYTQLIQGLLDLYEAGLDSQWLAWALQLQEELDATHWDKEQGGYFSVSTNTPHAVLSVKEDADMAEPSPNSVGAMNLLRLGVMLEDDKLKERAAQIFKVFGKPLESSPFSMPMMLSALDFQKYGDMRIVLAGQKGEPGFDALLKEVQGRFLPHAVLVHADGGAGQQLLDQKDEAVKAMGPVQGHAAAYVCHGRTCQAPVTKPEDFAKLLDGAGAAS